MRIFGKRTIGLVLISLFQLMSFGQPDRNSDLYNLGSERLGLQGFDPVSYFEEGGGVPQKGKAEHQIDFKGVVYMFANHENLETFLSDHEKFEPTYGGWCAWAMSFGNRVEINPKLFTINGNRIHFFAGARPKRAFDNDINGFETRADANWLKISGEQPRL